MCLFHSDSVCRFVVHQFSSEMVEFASNRYKVLQKIGEGVHGIVLKAQDLSNNRIVAIKKLPLRTKHGETSLSTIREVKSLQFCSCSYVSGNRFNFELLKLIKFISKDYRINRRVCWPDGTVDRTWVHAAFTLHETATGSRATFTCNNSLVYENVIARFEIFARDRNYASSEWRIVLSTIGIYW